jgi:hypothetical protein
MDASQESINHYCLLTSKLTNFLTRFDEKIILEQELTAIHPIFLENEDEIDLIRNDYQRKRCSFLYQKKKVHQNKKINPPKLD